MPVLVGQLLMLDFTTDTAIVTPWPQTPAGRVASSNSEDRSIESEAEDGDTD